MNCLNFFFANFAKKNFMKKKGEEQEKERFKVHSTDDYRTLYLGGGKSAKSDDKKKAEKDKKDIAHLIELLASNRNRQFKENALRELKSEAGKELLMKAIAVTEDYKIRRALVAACWEAGLDFSRYLSFFVQLALISDFESCLDVLTIIEDMQGPFDKKMLDESIAKLGAGKSKAGAQKKTLLDDMIAALERHRT